MNAVVEVALEMIAGMISGFIEGYCAVSDKKPSFNSIDLTAIDWRKEKPL